jgi:two-component system sensor histidine kinase KdpD
MPLRRYAGAVLAVTLVAAALRAASVAAVGIAAPLLLLDVLVVARLWGTGPALVAACYATGCLSYYFLPPEGFWIENPSDWVAFVAFLVTAIIAGELASRAERRAEEAQQGRQEIERLYQELQAAFDRASEAEAARRNEQLKVALLDALTHNVRTPLTSIKASVTALIVAGDWTPSSELSREGRGELLQVIDEETDRLNRFIEGLSSVDRASGRPAACRSVRVGDIVRAGVERAENLTRDHRTSVSLHEPIMPVSVDAASIIEVLYILLDNASKYCPAGTTIQVLAGGADEHSVRLVVADEGPGVPVELRDRVFENFYRIPGREPADRRRIGVGLGLSIARRLVEAQGGAIGIETPASGRGTAVVLTLPTVASHHDNVELADVPAPAGRDMRPPASLLAVGATTHYEPERDVDRRQTTSARR